MATLMFAFVKFCTDRIFLYKQDADLETVDRRFRWTFVNADTKTSDVKIFADFRSHISGRKKMAGTKDEEIQEQVKLY